MQGFGPRRTKWDDLTFTSLPLPGLSIHTSDEPKHDKPLSIWMSIENSNFVADCDTLNALILNVGGTSHAVTIKIKKILMLAVIKYNLLMLL